MEALSLPTNPVQTDNRDGVFVETVAGAIRLHPELELEVVPKFLNPDDLRWREDFFFLAVLSRTGAVLPREALLAELGSRGELATLISFALVEMFRQQARRPIRGYRSRSERSFALDGEIDPVDLLLPEEDGFAQSRLVLDSENHVNAVIYTAATILRSEVRDGATRQALDGVVRSLAPQHLVARAKRRSLLPRHRHWQTLFDLAVEVVNGLGFNYGDGFSHAPGFVLQTWQSWQQLLGLALHLGLPGYRVVEGPSIEFGRRRSGPLTANPDVLVRDRDAVYVVDAKYKTHVDRTLTVSNADIYESLAFMRAAGSKRTLLMYPQQGQQETSTAIATCDPFEQISVDDERIMAVEIPVKGLSAPGGFDRFIKVVADTTKDHLLTAPEQHKTHS